MGRRRELYWNCDFSQTWSIPITYDLMFSLRLCTEFLVRLLCEGSVDTLCSKRTNFPGNTVNRRTFSVPAYCITLSNWKDASMQWECHRLIHHYFPALTPFLLRVGATHFLLPLSDVTADYSDQYYLVFLNIEEIEHSMTLLKVKNKLQQLKIKVCLKLVSIWISENIENLTPTLMT